MLSPINRTDYATGFTRVGFRDNLFLEVLLFLLYFCSVVGSYTMGFGGEGYVIYFRRADPDRRESCAAPCFFS